MGSKLYRHAFVMGKLHFFSTKGISFYFLLSLWFIKNSVYNANSVDPDLTPQNETSDLDLHFLLMSLLWDVSHI